MAEATKAVPVGAPAQEFAPRSPVVAVVVILALLVWLFPFSLGTAMPVGGDVTQFFLGLMSVLATSLAERRIPVWNDLWGYGFPGVGESQMGAFYPPHLVLYGLLGVERAYVASLLLHTLWGGLGGYWASRKFGAGRLGAGLAGFAFAASGFFVIHMPHPWGYTTGSWLPWAWGLVWGLLKDQGPGTARRLFLLSVVLAIQVLPGHFQVAFMTQATVAVIAAWTLLERAARRTPGVAAGRSGLVVLGLTVVLPMAAAQVWPTARLAGLAADRRDYEYLSGFAATPFHLVSLAAPNLFHRSPLWRPLVWDPFHTSPEEYLAYVGIAPLFLAVLVVVREARRDAAVRCLAVLAAVCLVLSLGPYVPGFGWLIRLPGFSFFRAPARWGLPMSLALAMLAGLGVDRWRTWERPARGLLPLAVLAFLWIGAAVGLVELALWSTSPSGSRVAADLYERAFRIRPWEGDPDFRSVASLARRPSTDPLIPPALERAGYRRETAPRDARSFEQRRFEIYRAELAGTLAILAAVAALACVPRLHPHAPIVLVALTAVDLMLLGRHRLVDVGPLRPLGEQSPVLARLAKEPRGTRIIDPLRNLPMAAGLAPVQAYRTLDLPALTPLATVARGSLEAGPGRDAVLRALRATGAGLRLLDPIEVAAMRMRNAEPPGTVESIADPDLARWLFGADWNPSRQAWADEFQIVRPAAEGPRAWLPASDVPEDWDGDPRPVLDALDRARPLKAESRSPVEWEIALEGVARPGPVLVSVLYDPQWLAVVVDGGRETPANIGPAFRVGKGGGAWMRIGLAAAPGPGAVLRLRYDAADVRQGLWASGACWTAWGLAILYASRRGRRVARPAAD
ncbi:hypothetical protein [Paludisphaera mucosa]|uniref:Bacterial membrane protein YfhO n=1 Tax=Paludisphaera mucosa TaxID=3030827 RepID=A0ABT6F9B1_9BACT|nr:hypothetical protein [Paludisphaera mucosa]MDG3004179.1 hypothetical protein [Paludisphaera mucosa]